MGGFLASAFGGALSSIGSKALDFGAGAAASAMQYKMTRKLRRREYQDMMHSMRHAGLNPILAAGATPGHSTIAAPDTGGPTDIQGNIASAQESSRRQNLNAAEKELIGAQTTSAKAMAEKATQDAAASKYLMEAERLKLLSEVRSLGVQSDFTAGPNTAATWGLAELRGQESMLTQAKTQTEGLTQTLLTSRNISERASAALMNDQAALAQMETTLGEAKTKLVAIEQSKATAEQKAIEMANVKRAIESAWMNGPVGRRLQQFNIAAGQILGPISDLLKMAPEVGPSSKDKRAASSRARNHGQPKSSPLPGRAPYRY